MKVVPTKLDGALLIEPRIRTDFDDLVIEVYDKTLFAEYGIRAVFIQDNHSLSQQSGILRGLHYQLHPKAQAKLVRVISGAICDVIVDIRKGSPTYGEWQDFYLSAENKQQLLVPKGFAHGFCTLVEKTEVQYKVDEFYAPNCDRGIAWDDPLLNITWPTRSPILSEKDKKHPNLIDAEHHFIWEG
ncbi:dTDP-4-dehydrorhamnose 3,5-epimerase [Bacillus sp. CGMCC 1.16541]|uniref:dTDP-4-dehydrorhamnose 3,5-epimerase n=1 Tax=Bacillus sp. CGMCC 1.16541 TaxID=2185143 RepID=UPI000D72541C|nr:dTDP-4-dehydrorhamnose 3,5-epimerase [Bacillus sp. CGMCC 1.16541]